MTEGLKPQGTPEGWEQDDQSRMRRVHEALDIEYHQIPEGPCRRRYEGSVPNVGELSRERTG